MNHPFKDLTGMDRIRALEDNADETQIKTYEKQLDAETREEVASDLVETIQRVDVLTEELKQINKEKKAVISEEKLRLKEKARELRQGYRTETGKVYILREFAEGMAYEYDENGEFIGSRKLKPSERQTTIKQLNTKTA